MIARSLMRDERGAGAAEFTLVLPLLLLLLFGVIDGGRFLWTYNHAEKATQMGARLAVVTDPVAQDLVDKDYVGVGGLASGDIIPASALGEVKCGNTGNCTCTASCPGLSRDAAAFTRIVTRMQSMDARIAPTNVEVVYRGSGLGYAGDPSGMDVVPLVTVRLKGLQFQPLSSLMLATIAMPSFSTTLTAEDSVGIGSN